MMETGARYTLIGLFALAVIGAGFGFVYWLNNIGGIGERTSYRIEFADGVSGLRPGSVVLFNGIRVGEVTDLRIDPERLRGVTATVAIARNTPVRADTRVGVETQGLMGTPAIALQGGDGAAPALPAAAGALPTLTADPGASQDTLQAVRTVLQRVDGILVENAEPLRTTIANLKVFTDALARNSDKLDGIVEGIERMTGGGPPKAPVATFDLRTPPDLARPETLPDVQLAISDPSTVVAFETQRILIAGEGGESSSFPDVQWSDSLPKLFQARILQSFENAGFKRVSRPLDLPAADFQLMLDLRAFRIVQADQSAQIEIGAKLVANDGKVIDTRIFRATAPASATDVRKAVAALNDVFGQTVRELIPWTLAAI
jgi:phospholipid/cholesterol/gamma-HCH transport system substrate-binding protein